MVCCAETHKVKFNADLEVLRKSVKAIQEMRPMFPINEITDAAVVLCKTAYAVCKLYPPNIFKLQGTLMVVIYVQEEEILVPETAKPRSASISANPIASSPSSPRPLGVASSPSTAPRTLNSRSQVNYESAPEPAQVPATPATPAALLQDYKALARCVTGHLEVLRSRPMFPGEQGQIQLVQASVTKLEAATTEFVTVLQQVRSL